MENWYEKLAKTGLLGTKAQVSAEAHRGEWSEKDPVDLAKKKATDAAMKAKGNKDGFPQAT